MVLSYVIGGDNDRRVTPEECLVLIRIPSDRVIYTAFKEVARRWPTLIESERCTLEGDVSLTPSFGTETPSHFNKIINARVALIERLCLEVGGVTVTYRRVSGHGEYKLTSFDELRIELGPNPFIDLAELRELIASFSKSLLVVTVSGTPLFAELWNEIGSAYINKVATRALEGKDA